MFENIKQLSSHSKDDISEQLVLKTVVGFEQTQVLTILPLPLCISVSRFSPLL